MKIDVFDKMSSEDPSWTDFGSVGVAKKGPRRGLDRGKLEQKRVKKSKAKKVWSWEVLVGGRCRWALVNLRPGEIRGRPGYRRGYS